MRLDAYILSKTSLPADKLFGPNGAVRLVLNPDTGKQEIIAWDASLVGFARPSPADLAAIAAMPDKVQPAAVKNECKRRILAAASQAAQLNMTSFIAGGTATDAEKSAFSAWIIWVGQMRAKCAQLIQQNDNTFKADLNWPALPADAKALADRF